MSSRRIAGVLNLLALGLALVGGCADLSKVSTTIGASASPSGGMTATSTPTAAPTASAAPSVNADNNVVLTSFGGGFNGLTTAFMATSRLGVRALGVTTINLSDGASPGRYVSFRTYDNADFAAGKTFSIAAAPPAGTTPTSGSSLTYADNGKTWVSTGGGQARMVGRTGYDTTFVIENVPMAPPTPAYLAGSATGSVTVNFSGTFTSYSF